MGHVGYSDGHISKRIRRVLRVQATSDELRKFDICRSGIKLVQEFDSDGSLARRGRVASAYLKHLRIAEAEDVFDFFEKVGFFVRKGLIESDVAHSFFFHWANLYWIIGKPLIAERRAEAGGLWSDFEFLYNRLLQIEMKGDPRSRFINPTDELIRKSLEEELE